MVHTEEVITEAPATEVIIDSPATDVIMDLEGLVVDPKV